MKSLKVLTTLRILSTSNFAAASCRRPFSAQPQEEVPSATAAAASVSDTEAYESDSVFDSSHFSGFSSTVAQQPQQPTWDDKYRRKADKVVFGNEKIPQEERKRLEAEEEIRRRMLARKMLEFALESADDDVEEKPRVVREEDQKSLAVGVIGAPNAGKSSLTNYLVRLSPCTLVNLSVQLKSFHWSSFFSIFA